MGRALCSRRFSLHARIFKLPFSYVYVRKHTRDKNWMRGELASLMAHCTLVLQGAPPRLGYRSGWVGAPLHMCLQRCFWMQTHTHTLARPARGKIINFNANHTNLLSAVHSIPLAGSHRRKESEFRICLERKPFNRWIWGQGSRQFL